MTDHSSRIPFNVSHLFFQQRLCSNTTYIFKESGNIELNYKVYFGNFPIDLSLYKSTSYKNHYFLINSIHKKIISDQFLVLYNNNISSIKSLLENNIETYKSRIEENNQIYEPPIVTTNNLELAFIKNLGHYIINNISVYIGEQKIDMHTGEWLDIYNQLFTDYNTQYDKMIGNISELTDYTKKSKGKYRLYIPLRFWFCNKSGLALPLIALHNNSVKIEIKLNELEECIIYNKKGILKKSEEMQVRLLAEYIYLSEDERKLFGESKHEYLIERMQMSPGTTITTKNNDIAIDFHDPIKDLIWTLKPQNNIDTKDITTYCCVEEKIIYDNYQKEYLDNSKLYEKYVYEGIKEELIPNSFLDTYNIFKSLNSNSFNNYLREKYAKFYVLTGQPEIDGDWTFDYTGNINGENLWTSTAAHNLSINDIILFTSGDGASPYVTNKVYYVIKVPTTQTVQLSLSKEGDIIQGNEDSTNNWKANKINTGIIQQNNAINIYKKHIQKNEINREFFHAFEEGALNIYSRKITASKDANYYNILQTSAYMKTPKTGIYVHNFSLYPLEHQPSGSCNFSLTEDTRLEFSTTDLVTKNNPVILKMYGRSYNVLRVMSGFGGLAFYE